MAEILLILTRIETALSDGGGWWPLQKEKCEWEKRKTEGMNGDRGMMGNNAFPNVPIKNHHSQGIIIPSHSLSFLFL